MTISVSYADAAITDDATFRAWGVVVNAAFAAVGLVQTADTGQINWITVTKPTAAATLAGYEIWRFDDSLQATAPIFLRIEYRSGANTSGNNVRLSVMVGVSSDGAGTLGSPATTQAIVGNSVDTTAGNSTGQAIRTCFAAGSLVAFSDVFAVAGIYSISFCFVVSRTVNADGQPTGAGCYFWYAAHDGTQMTTWQQQLNFAGGTAIAVGNPNAAPPGDLTNVDSGNTTYVLPHYACLPEPHLVAGVLQIRGALQGGGPGRGTEFSCVMTGSTPHNYFVVNDGQQPFFAKHLFGQPGYFGNMTGLTSEIVYLGVAVIWE